MPTHALAARRRRSARCWCLAGTLALAFGAADAQNLSTKTKESGCIDKPKVVVGATYRCTTSSGAAAYFNVPEASEERSAPRSSNARTAVPAPAPVTSQPAPPGLPRVDSVTQKGRDDLRRKVLQDELATEEKLLLESRTAFSNGAPAASADEQKDPQRYADRIAKLRQAVQLHERNVDALRRELGLPR